VSGKEKKLLIIDHISIDQNKLDLRFALQTSEIFQEDHFLFPYAQQLVDSLHLDVSSGVLTFRNVPGMFVYMIRHKKRYSYKYEGLCKIDIANIELVDMQSNVFQVELPTGTQEAQFTENKTEVEVSLISWRKAFKFNKCLVGGHIGDYMRGKNPEAWSAAELLQDLERFIEISKSVSDLIFPVN